MTVEKSVLRSWLETLGLGRYVEVLVANDVDMEALRLLSDADLQALGFSLGHRRTLQDAIRSLNAAHATTQLDPSLAAGSQGERRQVTVLFCDLVGSSELATQFDPEDLRNLVHRYYSSCCKEIEACGGFVARVIGDGILAYFGYPVAREDAAECAIRAALRIVEAVHQPVIDASWRIDVRIGLATGVSVISSMVGIGFSELHAVLGPTPNLASRIQSLVEPGTIGISDETRRVAGGAFAYADQGVHLVKGFSRPVRVWGVVGEGRSGGRFDAQHPSPGDCFGRDTELAGLRDAWDRVQQGRCEVITLIGEAGIGKSRLLRTASERFAPSPHFVAFMQCSPSQSSTPLHPLIDWLRRDTRVSATDASDNRLRLNRWIGDEATALDLVLLADLLCVPLPDSRDGVLHLPPDRKRAMTRDVVWRHFERHCSSGPGLLIVEDAHWIDGATEEFLNALLLRFRDHKMMVIATQRPGGPSSWSRTADSSDVHLVSLAPADAMLVVRSACRGRELPPAVLDDILSRTDGVPLFIEELTAMILESGLLRDDGAALVMDGPMPTLDIPSTLRDSLMARLDRLSDIKDVARAGSALGREFTFSLLAQVSERPVDDLLAALDRLIEAGLLSRRDAPPEAEYVFKHALVQQAAYDSQLRSDRQALHRRIVKALETNHPEYARHEPGLMAYHCERAALVDREVDYLYAAGLASTRLVAIPQALSYFSRADSAIARLPVTAVNARRHIEIILGTMEVGRFAILPSRLVALSKQARALLQTDGVTLDPALTAAILFQDGRAQLYSSRYAEARRIFQEIRQLGHAHQDPAIERKPASAYCMTLCCQGLFSEMLDFVDPDMIDCYKQSGSFIDYIAVLGWSGYAHCQAGALDVGMEFGHRSVREAEHVQSQIYLAGAYIWRSHAFMASRRFEEAVADARRCVDLSASQSVPYLGWHGLVFLALCLSRSGEPDQAADALARARVLLGQVEDGVWSLLDYLPAIESEIACSRGDYGRARRLADEAIVVASSVEGHFTQAVAWRVKAVACIRGGGDLTEAQGYFDSGMRSHERGGALAEHTYSLLVWAHALHCAGLAKESVRWRDAAVASASRYGFDLGRCENGAASVLAKA